MAAPSVVAALELKLHPGDEYVGSWEPESLQVLVGTCWSRAASCTDCIMLAHPCPTLYIILQSFTRTDHAHIFETRVQG